jgi:hypothetical protein
METRVECYIALETAKRKRVFIEQHCGGDDLVDNIAHDCYLSMKNTRNQPVKKSREHIV